MGETGEVGLRACRKPHGLFLANGGGLGVRGDTGDAGRFDVVGDTGEIGGSDGGGVFRGILSEKV